MVAVVSGRIVDAVVVLMTSRPMKTGPVFARLPRSAALLLIKRRAVIPRHAAALTPR